MSEKSIFHAYEIKPFQRFFLEKRHTFINWSKFWQFLNRLINIARTLLKIHVALYKLLPCILYEFYLFLTDLFQCIYSFMRMRCQYKGQTGSHINCTNDKWYI